MRLVLSTVTRSEFDSLKDTMQMFKDNVEKNIDWFYASLAIIVTVLLVGLFFLVSDSIKRGIEKGIINTNNNLLSMIKNEKQLYTANGNASALGSGVFIISGLINFSPDKFVSLLVYKKVNGEVIPYKLEKIVDGTITITVNPQLLKDYDKDGNVISDGLIHWTLVWLKE
jgi:hypothetical protein